MMCNSQTLCLKTYCDSQTNEAVSFLKLIFVDFGASSKRFVFQACIIVAALRQPLIGWLDGWFLVETNHQKVSLQIEMVR
jgi:hypothetical protein